MPAQHLITKPSVHLLFLPGLLKNPLDNSLICNASPLIISTSCTEHEINFLHYDHPCSLGKYTQTKQLISQQLANPVWYEESQGLGNSTISSLFSSPWNRGHVSDASWQSVYRHQSPPDLTFGFLHIKTPLDWEGWFPIWGEFLYVIWVLIFILKHRSYMWHFSAHEFSACKNFWNICYSTVID